MTKKLLSMLLGLTLAVTVLTGCGSAPEAGKAEEPAAEAGTEEASESEETAQSEEAAEEARVIKSDF